MREAKKKTRVMGEAFTCTHTYCSTCIHSSQPERKPTNRVFTGREGESRPKQRLSASFSLLQTPTAAKTQPLVILQ